MRYQWLQQRVRLRRRVGFTLVEILVVIFIIGLLTSILLPAINTARETSYRTVSANNQKQLALALIQHNDTLGYLPHSQRDPNNPTLPRQGWGVQILPYIERKDLSDRFDYKKGWQDPDNIPVTVTRIETFINPTSPEPERLDDKPEASPWRGIVASGDYAVITHVANALYDAGYVDEAGDGIMPKNKISRLADVRDGLSHTILLTDSAGRPYQYIKGQRVGTPYESASSGGSTSGGTTGGTTGGGTAGATASQSTGGGTGGAGTPANSTEVPNTQVVRVNGGGWSRNASDISLEGWTVTRTVNASTKAINYSVTRTGPAAINVTNGEDVIPLGVSPNTQYYGSNGTGSIYSFHPGGVNAAFADGSVKFISEKVDIRILAKLVTRNGGESVADGTY